MLRLRAGVGAGGSAERRCSHNLAFTVLYVPYRGTSLTKNSACLGPYSRTGPKAFCWSWGGVLFLVSEVPLYSPDSGTLTSTRNFNTVASLSDTMFFNYEF